MTGLYYAGATVQLNTYCSGTEYERWNTACHELGHVLGLGHNTSTSSCVYAYRSSQRYPNTDDFNLLERYY
ncbi:matrixin family metalloprotease [Micromonospora sp. DR5-3]|uniref:matrixin family metalloprotease n=1 Tax=unclassified Micromonospora TaxID=2617518 RepID=UPI0011DB71E5|nr:MULTISPECIES: matrixin family metalloprotease [unclassified Micromonospora]MCW3816437.1 matrixin family metalloprotease [Micromonospora sp. DR5-3]TYC21510.1 matrixin family metalloprotease [Micromonospora sp. MP36]